jgi:hypothetical protein
VDKRRFRRKYLLGLLTSPLTLLPVVAGATCVMVSATLGVFFPAAALAGAVSLAVGGGVLFQRLVLGCEKIALAAQEEVEAETSRAREAELDSLDEELVRDRDARTQAALRDVRVLVDAFDKSDLWKESINAKSRFDLLCTIEDIFRQCVTSLRRTLELQRLAKETATDEVREPIMAQREKIIAGVQKSVARLAQTLRHLSELGASKESLGPGLTKLGEELSHQLDIARRVDERMKSLGLENDERE